MDEQILYDDTALVWSSFVAMVAVFAIYLWFIFIAGPKYMSKRDPMDLTSVTRVYNIFQVVACTTLVTYVCKQGFAYSYLFKCERFDFLSDSVKVKAQIGYWLFLCLRMLELLETVFFILRKKPNQASFLHVFHHIIVATLTWMFIATRAEYTAIYVASINSTVHIFMYFYYFCSSFKNPTWQSILETIKPLITMIQLVQHFILVTHCFIVWRHCGFHYFFLLLTINCAFFFYLFGKFYIKEYILKKENEAANSAEKFASKSK